MHVLFVSQSFPPDRRVGSHRASSVVRAFVEAGHRVSVVTAALEGEPPGIRLAQPNLTVHAVPVGPLYRERATRLLRRLRGGASGREAGPASAPADVTAAPPADVAGGRDNFLRRLTLALLWLPDDEQRFIGPAFRQGRELARDGIDLIYTTAPSFSTHLAGLLLRRRTGVRWVAEFRDPWIHERSGTAEGRERVAVVDRLNRALERRCLAAADRIVTVTERARDLYRRRLGPGAAEKVVVARNGIAALDPSPGPRSGPFRIVYSGSIYAGRDPSAFLTALATVARERALTATDVVVDLYVGRTRFIGTVPIDAFAAELGIGHLVRVLDWVPHAELMRSLREADLLLLLAQRQPVQVPNKLYEYLAMRVPILAFVDDDGESAHMLRQVGGHYVLTSDDHEPIVAALRSALARPVAAPSSEVVLHEWLTERQMQRLLAAVGA